MNVWIEEDDPGYRRNLRMSLAMEEGIVVARVFPSCVEFFEALGTETPPDAVQMDLGLPGTSGIDAIRRLSTITSAVYVMVLTVFKENEKVKAALNAGDAGYLLKESAGPEISKALREIFEGIST